MRKRNLSLALLNILLFFVLPGCGDEKSDAPPAAEKFRRPEMAGPVVPLKKLGITGFMLKAEFAEFIHLSYKQKGVLIEKIDLHGPADKAGLKGGYRTFIFDGELLSLGGDVIVAFDGKPVTSSEDLGAHLRQARPGQKVKLELLRDGKPLQVEVTLG